MDKLKKQIKQLKVTKKDAIVTVNNEEQMKEIVTFIRHDVYRDKLMIVKYAPSLTTIDVQNHCINIMIVKCKDPSIYIASVDEESDPNNELKKLAKDLQELTAKYDELAEKIISGISKI